MSNQNQKKYEESLLVAFELELEDSKGRLESVVNSNQNMISIPDSFFGRSRILQTFTGKEFG